MDILDINQGNFDKEVLQEKNLVVVDFWATWCPPCVEMGKNLKEVAANLAAEKLDSAVKIVKVDVDNNQEIAANYSIRSIPTLIYFKNGEKLLQDTGLKSVNDLTNLIKGFVQNS